MIISVMLHSKMVEANEVDLVVSVVQTFQIYLKIFLVSLVEEEVQEAEVQIIEAQI